MGDFLIIFVFLLFPKIINFCKLLDTEPIVAKEDVGTSIIWFDGNFIFENKKLFCTIWPKVPADLIKFIFWFFSFEKDKQFITEPVGIFFKTVRKPNFKSIFLESQQIKEPGKI